MVFNEVCNTNEDQQTSAAPMVPNPQLTTPAEPADITTAASQPGIVMANMDSVPVNQASDATDEQWNSQPVQY